VFVYYLIFPFCNDHQLFGVSRLRNPWWSSRWWICSIHVGPHVGFRLTNELLL